MEEKDAEKLQILKLIQQTIPDLHSPCARIEDTAVKKLTS